MRLCETCKYRDKTEYFKPCIVYRDDCKLYEEKEITMDDCISRQAVLDACQKICDADCEYSKKQRFVMCGACNLGTAIETIEDMPSVTPIIHLEDFKRFATENNYAIMTTEMYSRAIDAIDYAERTGHWISIDDVMSVFDDFMCGEVDEDGTDTFLEMLRDKAEQYPQEPKTGHWKRVSIDKYVQHAMAFYRCSECGEDIIGEHNYCPNCGCRMVEPQESEEV